MMNLIIILYYFILFDVININITITYIISNLISTIINLLIIENYFIININRIIINSHQHYYYYHHIIFNQT